MAFLASLLPEFGFRAQVFFHGDFCSQNLFTGEDPVGHLHIVRAGRVIVEHDEGPALEVKVPSLVIYPRPCRHRLIVPESAELTCATIAFKNPQRNPLTKLFPSYLVVPLSELRGMTKTLQLLVAEASANEDGKQEVMDRLCDILLIQFFRRIQQTSALQIDGLASSSDSRIARAVTAMRDAPARAWTIEELAQAASMSRSAFAKRFHETVGMPPATYLTEMRLTLATSHLRQNASIKQTALAVGYSSPPAFTKAFTARFGMAPLKWRAAQQ